MLSTDSSTIQWISVNKTNHAIHLSTTPECVWVMESLESNMLSENKRAKRLKRNSIVFISRVNGQYLKKLNFHHSDLTGFVFQGHFVVVRDKFTWT